MSPTERQEAATASLVRKIFEAAEARGEKAGRLALARELLRMEDEGRLEQAMRLLREQTPP